MSAKPGQPGPPGTMMDSVPDVVLRSVVVGLGLLLVGTVPRHALFAANLRFVPDVPWSVPILAIGLGFFWSFLAGAGPPAESSHQRREWLRAHPISGRTWLWSMLAGLLGLIALAAAQQLFGRLLELPLPILPDLSQVPDQTVITLLAAGAPIAAIVEEAALRGYMQGPIERRCGLLPAILITGTVFAGARFELTPQLWPYHLAVAALYGSITHFANSIRPVVVLHTLAALSASLQLWLRGRKEWSLAAPGPDSLWITGWDPEVAGVVSCLGAALALLALALRQLARR